MKTKTKSQIDSARIERNRMFRANPLPGLTPEMITSYHSRFKQGYLGSAAILWDDMAQIDDTLMSVIPKRKKSVSRHGYEITTVNDSPKAKLHAATLKAFYDNVVCTDANDMNVKGGMRTLLMQMMDAMGKKYSAHEIIWKYTDGTLSAEFRHVPLWFFENTSGRLRYLATDNALVGVELEPGGWMVTVGDGLMMPCAAAYMFKHLPIQDWLIFCEKYVFPTAYGKCDAQPGDESWEAMEAAVSDLSGGDSIVISSAAELGTLDLNNGQLPYPELIDRMDRAMATLWRGGDLSTSSNANAVGATLQDEEKDALEQDDAALLTDTLNEQVDKWVIRYAHGDATPLAWVQIKTAQRQDVQADLEIDKGLGEMGYADTDEALRERYARPGLGRRQNAEGGITKVEQEPANSDLPNEAEGTTDYLAVAVHLYAEARAQDLKPLADRLAHLLENTPDNELERELQNIQRDFPKLAESIFDAQAMTDALIEAQTAAMAEGLEEGDKDE